MSNFKLKLTPLVVGLILLIAILSAGCTTPPPKVDPPTPEIVVPSECQKEVIANRFTSILSKLSPHFRDLSPEAQARELLSLKADDATQYNELRALAMRCAAWGESL